MEAKSGLGWRFITAGVLVPILLLTLFWLPAWTLLLVASLVTLAAALEALGLAAPAGQGLDPVERAVGALAAVGVCVGATLSARDDPRLLALLFPAVFLLALLLLVFRPREIETFSTRAAWLVFGPLYAGAGVAVYPIFRLTCVDGGRWVVLVMMITFFADTAAYFSGRFLGKHKLHPRLSPKKTWEGSIGGLAGSLLGTLVAKLWYLPSLPWLDVFILPLAAGAIGQCGDLFESALKRSAGVKDSGTLLPGHGGMLDRIDALIPAGLVVLTYAAARGLLLPLPG